MSGITKIFVDGNCVVCDLEVSHYKRMAPELFELVDISDPGFDAGRFGLTADSVNKVMHVQTPDGTFLRGVDAFAHIWSRLPKYSLAAKAVELPVLRELAKVGYSGFAVIRPWLPKKSR